MGRTDKSLITSEGTKLMTDRQYAMTIFKLMALIENKTGKMFQETHGELEKDFWDAVDTGNSNKVKFVYNQLCKEFDSLNA